MAALHSLIDGVVSDDSQEATLLGCRCAQCQTLFFPERPSCERCGSTAMRGERLPTAGTLWSWTSQNFPPPSPPYFRRHDKTDFAPYFVGYVDLGETMVLARLSFADKVPSIGASMRMRWAPLPGSDASVPAQIPVFALQDGPA